MKAGAERAIYSAARPAPASPLHRRRLLLAGLSLPAATLLSGRLAIAQDTGQRAVAGADGAFDDATVPALAAALAARAYRPPSRELPAALAAEDFWASWAAR